MYAGSPKHPIFSGSTFGLMSGEKPFFKPQVEGGHEALGSALDQMGLHHEETSGKYQDPERSYIIHNPSLEQMQQLGKMFGQESVVHSQNGQHRLVFTNGEHEGKYHPAQSQTPIEHFEQPPPDSYTKIPGAGYMRINFDWNQQHPLEGHVKKSELSKGNVIKLNPPVPSGKKFRANAQVTAIGTPANTVWDAPGDSDHNQIQDPAARVRAKAGTIPNFTEPKAAARGIGTGKNIYNYTHLLDPSSAANGYSLHVQHTPGQNDNYMTAEIRSPQGGSVGKHWAYPTTAIPPSVPGPIRAALENHQNWIKFGMNKSEREFTPEQVVYLAKNAVAQLLMAHKPVKAHPHAYEWHDGHTSHHQEDMAGAQLPVLQKDETGNEQAAGVGVNTYKQFALPYGNVNTGQSSDLLHYKYHGKLPEIEKLVHDHGFKSYYAGGKYGKPDLANKNYNSGHLMIYDPTPEGGGDFGHEEYTKGWRQIHELAHALTYPEINKIYGEGRRIGKLGTHRNLNEALRAVHWEWLAGHKQRELSKQIGVPIKDEDFHRELNTVMHDAAHRAVTGKFTEPSGEGFVPHAHKVPLHTALQMVRDSAHQMGLQGLHDTLKKPDSVQKSLQKSSHEETLLPGHPAYNALRELAKRQSELHAKYHALPSGPEKIAVKADMRKLYAAVRHIKNGGQPTMPTPRVTQDPAAKGVNPYTFQVPGATVDKRDLPKRQNPNGYVPDIKWKKSETADTIYNTARGDIPVANEKTYTIEEANAILLKATREKVQAFEKEFQVLRERELKKAVIPTHRHNQSMQASSGVEDIPPGKLNPKGVDKSMEKNAVMGYPGASGNPVAGPTTSPLMQNETTSTQSMALSEKCAKCGDMHMSKNSMCKGSKVEKADLVSEKGKRTDNHTVPTSKLPDDAKSKKVNEGTAKDPGSGGIKLPGSNLKKNITGGPQSMSNLLRPGKPAVQKAEPLSKPPVSEAQRRAMGAAASGNSTLDIPKSVGKEFIDADKGGKLPKHKKEELEKKALCPPKPEKEKKLQIFSVTSAPAPTAAVPMAKAAQPPMAKPPSGKNMGTAVPTSAPKAPAMPKPPTMKGELEKGHLEGKPGADVWAGEGAPERHEVAKPTGAKPQFTAANLAAGKQALAAKGIPIGGLRSPAAAGVTRAPLPVVSAPKPVAPTAAQPAAAKPGIFGRLLGKK